MTHFPHLALVIDRSGSMSGHRDEDYQAGKRHLETALLQERYPYYEDDNILRVQKIAHNYADRLNEFDAVTNK